VIQSVFGSAIGELFLVAVPLAVITILALVFLPNKPLGVKTTGQRIAGGEGPAGDHTDADADAHAAASPMVPIVIETIAQPGEPAGGTGRPRE